MKKEWKGFDDLIKISIELVSSKLSLYEKRSIDRFLGVSDITLLQLVGIFSLTIHTVNLDYTIYYTFL